MTFTSFCFSFSTAWFASTLAGFSGTDGFGAGRCGAGRTGTGGSTCGLGVCGLSSPLIPPCSPRIET